jgi:hypothetical protein
LAVERRLDARRRTSSSIILVVITLGGIDDEVDPVE